MQTWKSCRECSRIKLNCLHSLSTGLVDRDSELPDQRQRLASGADQSVVGSVRRRPTGEGHRHTFGTVEVLSVVLACVFYRCRKSAQQQLGLFFASGARQTTICCLLLCCFQSMHIRFLEHCAIASKAWNPSPRWLVYNLENIRIYQRLSHRIYGVEFTYQTLINSQAVGIKNWTISCSFLDLGIIISIVFKCCYCIQWWISYMSTHLHPRLWGCFHVGIYGENLWDLVIFEQDWWIKNW